MSFLPHATFADYREDLLAQIVPHLIPCESEDSKSLFHTVAIYSSSKSSSLKNLTPAQLPIQYNIIASEYALETTVNPIADTYRCLCGTDCPAGDFTFWRNGITQRLFGFGHCCVGFAGRSLPNGALIKSQNAIVQHVMNRVMLLSGDPRPIGQKLSILTNRKADGIPVQIWEFNNPADGITYWVFYLIGSKYELLLNTLNQSGGENEELPAQHNGSFSITMTSESTYRITLVDKCKVLKYDPVSITPRGLQIRKEHDRGVIFSNWADLLDRLGPMLQTLLYIAIPKRILEPTLISQVEVKQSQKSKGTSVTHVLIIGCSLSTIKDDSPITDAKKMDDVLAKCPTTKPLKITKLVGHLTVDDCISAMTSIYDIAKEGDNVLFYYSGYGRYSGKMANGSKSLMFNFPDKSDFLVSWLEYWLTALFCVKRISYAWILLDTSFDQSTATQPTSHRSGARNLAEVTTPSVTWINHGRLFGNKETTVPPGFTSSVIVPQFYWAHRCIIVSASQAGNPAFYSQQEAGMFTHALTRELEGLSSTKSNWDNFLSHVSSWMVDSKHQQKPNVSGCLTVLRQRVFFPEEDSYLAPNVVYIDNWTKTDNQTDIMVNAGSLVGISAQHNFLIQSNCQSSTFINYPIHRDDFCQATPTSIGLFNSKLTVTAKSITPCRGSQALVLPRKDLLLNLIAGDPSSEGLVARLKQHPTIKEISSDGVPQISTDENLQREGSFDVKIYRNRRVLDIPTYVYIESDVIPAKIASDIATIRSAGINGPLLTQLEYCLLLCGELIVKSAPISIDTLHTTYSILGISIQQLQHALGQENPITLIFKMWYARICLLIVLALRVQIATKEQINQYIVHAILSFDELANQNIAFAADLCRFARQLDLAIELEQQYFVTMPEICLASDKTFIPGRAVVGIPIEASGLVSSIHCRYWALMKLVAAAKCQRQYEGKAVMQLMNNGKQLVISGKDYPSISVPAESKIDIFTWLTTNENFERFRFHCFDQKMDSSVKILTRGSNLLGHAINIKKESSKPVTRLGSITVHTDHLRQYYETDPNKFIPRSHYPVDNCDNFRLPLTYVGVCVVLDVPQCTGLFDIRHLEQQFIDYSGSTWRGGNDNTETPNDVDRIQPQMLVIGVGVNE